MKPHLVTDFETIPLLASLNEPYPEGERNPPSNWKDESKIEAWKMNDRQEWAATIAHKGSTNPRLGRILAMGWGYENDRVEIDYALTEAEEPAMVRKAWDRIAEYDGRIATWNGRGFDARWLVVRSLALGIQPSVPPEVIGDWMRKYNSTYHVDCKLLLLDGDGMSKEGMSEWCRLLGIPPKLEGMDGSQVYPAFLRGDHQLIKDYLHSDIRGVQGIYARIAPFFVPVANERKHGIMMESFQPDATVRVKPALSGIAEPVTAVDLSSLDAPAIASADAPSIGSTTPSAPSAALASA